MDHWFPQTTKFCQFSGGSTVLVFAHNTHAHNTKIQRRHLRCTTPTPTPASPHELPDAAWAAHSHGKLPRRKARHLYRNALSRAATLLRQANRLHTFEPLLGLANSGGKQIRRGDAGWSGAAGGGMHCKQREQEARASSTQQQQSQHTQQIAEASEEAQRTSAAKVENTAYYRHSLAAGIDKNIPRAHTTHAVLVRDGGISACRRVVASRCCSSSSIGVRSRRHAPAQARASAGLALPADVVHGTDGHGYRADRPFSPPPDPRSALLPTLDATYFAEYKLAGLSSPCGSQHLMVHN